MENMKAVIFKDIGQFEVTERPVPQIEKDNDILIKILAASICGTDMHILADPPEYFAEKGVILGHECVGEVVACGAGVKGFEPGDHLILDNNIQCGVCPSCLEGNANVCEDVKAMGQQIDGVFAQYAVVPESNVVKIKKETPIDTAIFAEPLNCVMGGVKKLKVMPGDNVLILGGGPIGMYFATLMKKEGAGKVFVSEPNAFRAEYALKSGADRVINPIEENLHEEIMKETDGRGCDIVIECVGVLINDAIDNIKPAGQILLFGLNANAKQEICMSNIVRKGVTVYGNFIGNGVLGTVGKMLDAGLVNFDHLITHRLPLEKFGEGVEAMKSGKAFEVVLYPFEEMR